MLEKLAIVTIDAGSNVTGKSPLFPSSRVGTSSGKGTLAQAIRDVGGLAYDSGRAYRTIALAASTEGLDAQSDDLGSTLDSWEEAGRFGHCATGLALDGQEIDERILHGVEVSSIVAGFGARPEVRELTKRMKVGWFNSYVGSNKLGLVALDGRGMRELVEDRILQQIPNSELVVPFCMVVDVAEAARRRMAQRGVIVYDNPGWSLHPKTAETIAELEKRARKDEERTDDPVGIPEDRINYLENEGRLELTPASRATIEPHILNKRDVLVDTTGAGIDEVRRACLGHILQALETLEGFDNQASALEEHLAA